MEKIAEIMSGDAETFLFRNSESAEKLLHAILRGISENTIKYQSKTLMSGTIVFADGSFFTPNIILKLLTVAKKQG